MSRKSHSETQAAAPSVSSIVYLQQDWGDWIAGKVLRLDADLAATFASEHVRHRPATEREIALAGVL